MLRIHILLPYFKSASHFDSYSSCSQQLPRKRWLARRSDGRRASRRCPRRRGLVDWNVVNSGLMRGRGSSIMKQSTHFSQGDRSIPPLPPLLPPPPPTSASPHSSSLLLLSPTVPQAAVSASKQRAESLPPGPAPAGPCRLERGQLRADAGQSLQHSEGEHAF